MTDSELQDLLRVAGTFFASAARAHCEDMPEDSNAFSVLALAGAAVPEVRVVLIPAGPCVEVGYTTRGGWMPFLTWHAPTPKPSEVN